MYIPKINMASLNIDAKRAITPIKNSKGLKVGVEEVIGEPPFQKLKIYSLNEMGEKILRIFTNIEDGIESKVSVLYDENGKAPKFVTDTLSNLKTKLFGQKGI